MVKLFERCLRAKYIHTDNGGDYAIEVEDGTIYILFEWSDGKEDWKNNFDFPAKPYRYMDNLWFCHRGFLKVWKAMRDEINEKVQDIIDTDYTIKNIVCVGYSHGGAMSLFATEDMMYQYGDILTVEGYGFGAPRVVWGFVPKAVKTRLKAFKVVRNIPDIVTHLPPRIFGFRHITKPIRIGEPGRYTPIDAHRPVAYTMMLLRH